MRPLLPIGILLSVFMQACGAGPTAPVSIPSVRPNVLADFESGQIPKNNAGNAYISQYLGDKGEASLAVVRGSRDSGSLLRATLLKGTLYLQFNAHNANGTRGFAREYVADPKSWRFNTYNRFRFLMRKPIGSDPLRTGGQANMQFGTYVKRVKDSDKYDDETGGGHWYHRANLPNTGEWTRVIINMHPSHRRSAQGGFEHGNQNHPTGESAYNYFDALTRFYIDLEKEFDGVPLEYDFDGFEFYQERRPEADEQVYTLTATRGLGGKGIIVTWCRHKDENAVRHEVRWSKRDIHEIGWNAAERAPGGMVAPEGPQGYNGMTYSTTAIDEPGPFFVAVKPENSKLFSQIEILPGRP